MRRRRLAALDNQSFSDYDKFAWLFQREWGDFCLRLAPALKRVVLSRLVAGSRILDLCCGAGQLAKLLSEEGYRVTGLDASARMLELARINAPLSDFVQADARNFRLMGTFSAVLSTFDSLNHVMSPGQLKAVFRSVRDCLVERGLFAFDLNTLQAYSHEWQGYLEVVEKPGYLYVNQAGFDRKSGRAYTRCILFRHKGQSWERSEARLEQRYHPVEAVKRALEETGFTDVRQYSLDRAFSLHRYSEKLGRVLFVARKGDSST